MNHKKKGKVAALILAAGSGKRMGSDVPKQYMCLKERPILSYTLQAFEESSVDEIILVVSADDMEYCKEHILYKYHTSKVKKLVTGGKERYESVYLGLKEISSCDYVLIHDGARPFVTVDLIERCIEEVKKYRGVIVGVPVKDTIKMVNQDGVITGTPDRNILWSIQTPQCFDYELIYNSYKILIEELHSQGNLQTSITDDAMVVEYTTKHPVHVSMGSYSNIKITTKEDLITGERILEHGIF